MKAKQKEAFAVLQDELQSAINKAKRAGVDWDAIYGAVGGAKLNLEYVLCKGFQNAYAPAPTAAGGESNGG